MKVIITLGLPASGKSTWSRKYQQENENVLILNRDSIRAMLGGKWTAKYEELVKEIEMDSLIKCLTIQKEGTVIVDDTNLNPKTLNAIIRICNAYSAYVEMKSFLNVSALECIERDKTRENSVGEHVIMRMEPQVRKIKEILHI